MGLDPGDTSGRSAIHLPFLSRIDTEREAGLRLGNQRWFLDRNLADTCFGPDTEVELWSATPSLFGWQRVVLDNGDRIPGLAHGLLGAGASAVLDLAWPVHDLVKALVCEHYSSRHTYTAPEATPPDSRDRTRD